VETSPFGRPLEDFLLCPPVIVNTETLGITPIGVKLLQHKDGKHHVFDWVGAEHYPNVADFIEEAKRYGISRRASRTVEFSKITDGSRLVLLHSRAHINLHQMYQRSRLWPGCICGRPNHTDNAEYDRMCVGLYREDLDGGLPIADPLALAKELSAVTDQNARLVERAMPFGKYFGGQRPPDADHSCRVASMRSRSSPASPWGASS
jgi:hypothetical protein